MDDPFAPGLLARLPAPPRKVALLRASRIGDFVCATPAFRALRAALPGAEITLIALPFVRELVARCPDLDRFVAFPGFPGMADQFFDARAAVAFFAAMQAEEFDLAIQMHGSGLYSNPFTLLLGARVTAGWVRPGDAPGRLAAALPMPGTGHEVERVRGLATFLGAPEVDPRPAYPLWPGDAQEAAALLAGVPRPLIGIHPATRDLIKRWPLDRFAAVGRALHHRYGGTIVVIAGPDELEPAAAVAAAVSGPCLNLAGQTSLSVLGAVLDQLAVLVTNDSGPAHIAYARGAPTVVIFGGTDPAQWGPPPGARHRALAHPVPCRPCGLPACPIEDRCLVGVSAANVEAAVREVIRMV